MQPMLGQRIREFREKQSLKVSTLARKANVTKSYISHIEHGRATPSLKTLEKIASALGCHLAELLPASNNESQGTTPLPRAAGK